MELSIGKELNQEKFEELVAGTCLESLSLDELVDIALNSEEMNPGEYNTWVLSGSYYRLNLNNLPMIIIDREPIIRGYNNSQLELNLLDDNTFKCNDNFYENLVYSKIEEKEQVKEL